MGKYLVKKALILVFTLLVTSFVVFAIFAILPGDPAVHKLGTQATPERLELMREEMGLNEPFVLRYVKWLGSIFTLEFGRSYSYSCSVGSLIVSKIPINLTLSVMALLIVCAVSVPMGIYTAKHVGGKADKLVMALNQFFMSLPPFLLGLLICMVIMHETVVHRTKMPANP